MLSKAAIILSASAVVGASSTERELQAAPANGALTPFCKKTSGVSPISTAAQITAVHAAVSAELNALLLSYDAKPLTEALFLRANLFGTMLRTSFHDCGEFSAASPDKLGCDGCLSNSAPNSGLKEATTLLMAVFEPMWQRYCDKITRADFYALLGKLGVEKGDVTNTANVPFSYGRIDNKICSGGIGRLPDHQIGLSEFNRVFIGQMQLTMLDAMVLQAAHTVGHVHPEFSGFGIKSALRTLSANPNTNAWEESPWIFDNMYFASLVNEPWVNSQQGTNRAINFWKVKFDALPVVPGAPIVPHSNTLMLNADMVMAFLADTNPDPVRDPSGHNIGIINEFCGLTAIGGLTYGCTSPKGNKPGWPAATYDKANFYITNNAAFLTDFADAYYKMINTGYSVDGVAQTGRSSKVGNLQSINLVAAPGPTPPAIAPIVV